VAGEAGPFIDSTGTPLVGEPNAIRPGTCAVIFDDDGKVLLERRSDNGFWGLPGGAVDIGESVEQAIKREVMEETSLTVEVKRLIGVYSDPLRYNISSYPDGNVVHWVTVVFECVRIGGELRISHESTDIRYFDVGDLPENTLRSHTIRVSDALDTASGPLIK
jgi:ADP-ribose pyrophosphatase YjhB (NUDIX family)